MPDTETMQAVDPWSAELPSDYEKKISDFGLTKFDNEGIEDDLINRIQDPHYTMRRGIMFAHRDFNRIVDAINDKEPFIMMTGLMPSGKMHIGHKLVIDQIRWYQEQGADVVMAISDIEAWVARGMPSEETRRIAIEEYITNYLALGLDPGKVDVYSQWKRDDLLNLAAAFSAKKTFGEMQAIYGFIDTEKDDWSIPAGKTFFPFVQVADILHPQLPQYGGPRPTVVPVGLDQDPHLRLTRAIADDWRIYNTKFMPEHGEVLVYVKSEDVGKSLKSIKEKLIGLGLEEKTLDLEGNEIDAIRRVSNSNALLVHGAGKSEIEAIEDYLTDEGENVYVTDNRFGIFVDQDLDKDRRDGLLEVANELLMAMGYKQIEVMPDYGAIFVYDRGDIKDRTIDEKLLKYETQLGKPVFHKPASTYNKLARGLTGGKMSSSDPNSAIFLTDKPEEVKAKIGRAETGGRETADLQRKLGGEPENCMIYELLLFGHPDDVVVENTFTSCKSGDRLCGECKKTTSEYFGKWMSDFQQRRQELIESGAVKDFIEKQEIFRKTQHLC